MAGVSIGIIVIESASSGGSLITSQGRTVFALPGRVDQPSSAGCHRLIREGATLLRAVPGTWWKNLGPFFPFLNPLPQAEKDTPVHTSGTMSEEEEKTLHALSDGILGLDDLCGLTSLPAPEIMASLTMLELNRLVSKRPDDRYEANLKGRVFGCGNESALCGQDMPQIEITLGIPLIG